MKESGLAAGLMGAFRKRVKARFWEEAWGERMREHRRDPEAFAQEVLGSRWWARQREVAEAVAQHRRTAVKSANGVGKTYLAADLALWFLYSHAPSIVLTTAPTWRQVRHLLWEEIGRRHRRARIPLPGALLITRLTVKEGWFALGLATGTPDRFQGFHSENILIVLDEASGVPDAIWDAAEGVAVGGNNKILAIGNPLQASGRFHEIFRSGTGWRRLTISALEHPNVTGAGDPIPGAVTTGAIDARVAEWCVEMADGASLDHPPSSVEVFEWRGRRYRPNDLFRARVLGEFPLCDETALIPLAWIEAAQERELEAEGLCRAAADVARFGVDSTVIGVRRGPVVTRLEATRGCDLMEVAGRIARVAYEEHPESIAVDAVGLGAGVADRLIEQGIPGVEPVNVANTARDPERFANRRAELYWGLRERFRAGEIAIPRDSALAAELASIRYKINSRGQVQMESKEEMKRRGLRSPDRADMLALLMDGAGDCFVSISSHGDLPPSPLEAMRRAMAGW